MAPSVAPAFSKDEKALCFHHELLYEAKVLDIRAHGSGQKSTYEYKVHYKGWKNTWDDWVPQERLRKLTEDNLQLAKQLKKEVEQLQKQPRPDTKKPGGQKRKGGESVRATSSPVPQIVNKKRGRDLETEKAEEYENTFQIEIVMPEMLLSILVDDWELVTKHLQITCAPSPHPVTRVLEEWAAYEEEQRKGDDASIEILKEMVSGIRCFFNVALGRVLLYRLERVQYADIYHATRNPTHDVAGKKMSDIYGPEHLLRMLTKLPEYCSHSGMDKQSLLRAKEEIQRLANWLGKPENVEKYFSTPYLVPNRAYLEEADAA